MNAWKVEVGLRYQTVLVSLWSRSCAYNYASAVKRRRLQWISTVVAQ